MAAISYRACSLRGVTGLAVADHTATALTFPSKSQPGNCKGEADVMNGAVVLTGSSWRLRRDHPW